MRFNKSQIVWLLFALVCLYGAYLLGKSSSVNKRNNPVSREESVQIVPILKEPEQSWKDVPINEASNLKKPQTNNTKNALTSEPAKKDREEVLPLILNQKEKIAEFIAQAKPEEIDFYLGQYFNNEILDEISDKKSLSMRLLKEYSKVESPEINTIHGDIIFSVSSNYPEEITNSFNLNNKQKMYAHLKLNGSIDNSKAVFIRWISLVDNKVLLFERKAINISSNRNWVSFKPKKDWEIGPYLVTFYSFDSELGVIAQNTYHIDYVGK